MYGNRPTIWWKIRKKKIMVFEHVKTFQQSGLVNSYLMNNL